MSAIYTMADKKEGPPRCGGPSLCMNGGKGYLNITFLPFLM